MFIPLIEGGGLCKNMRGSMFNSNEKPGSINGGLVNQMNIPLFFMDWRMLVIVGVLYVSMSYFIHVYYYNNICDSVFNIFFFMGLLIFDQNKVSIDHEKVQISNSILKSIIIPKYNITGIKAVDNDYYKSNKFMNIIVFIGVLFYVVLTILNLYDYTIHSIALEKIEESIASAISSTFLIIFIYHIYHRRSHYPKYIEIDAGKKKITLYTRNEVEFNSLKEKLEYGLRPS